MSPYFSPQLGSASARNLRATGAGAVELRPPLQCVVDEDGLFYSRIQRHHRGPNLSQPQYAGQWLEISDDSVSRSRCEQNGVERAAKPDVLSAARYTFERLEYQSADIDACDVTLNGTSYHTVLVYENNEYMRQDIFRLLERKATGPRRAKDLSHLAGHLRAPPAPPRRFRKIMPKGSYEAGQTGDTRWREASYILAVMLERARA